MTRRCPKCSSELPHGGVICPACDFVVDTGFLNELAAADAAFGEAHVDVAGAAVHDNAKTAPTPFAPPEDALAKTSPPPPAPVSFPADDQAPAFEAFLAQSTTTTLAGGTVFETAAGAAALDLASMAEASAVLMRAATSMPTLTPIELFVFSFIDGARPVARIRMKTQLAAPDLANTIGLLAKRRVIKLKGHLREA